MALLMLTACSANTASLELKNDGTLSSTVSKVANEFENIEKDGYYVAAKNDNFTLFYEPKGLTIRLLNNNTGVVTTSAAEPDEEASAAWKNFVNSGIVLEYFKGEATNINKLNMYSGNPNTKISLIKDGFAAELDFKMIGISLTVFITLNEDGIRVQVPFSSIKESNQQYRLAAIYVLPFLGYTKLGEVDGYMLIPDGSGAIISLEDKHEKFSQPYKAKIYGGNYSVEANTYAVQKYDEEVATTADSAEIFAAVFGMVHTTEKDAFLGIIESGKYNAEIYAYPNGVITQYNWITARYIYREVYQYLTGQTGSISSTQVKPETFDIDVVYRFTGGDDASYVGLAKSYRQYLIENNLVNPNANTEYSTRLDFFAGDREKALIGKKFVTMTTLEQIDTVIGELVDSGLDKLSVTLKGWQKNGIYGKIQDNLSFEKSVGSIKEYSKLSDKYQKNAEFMLYGDYLNVYDISGSKEYIYQYNGKVFSSETHLELNPQKYRYTAPNVAKSIEKSVKTLQKYANIGIVFDGVTNEVYSYSAGSKMNMYSRQFAANTHIDALKSASDKINTAYVSSNDYNWGNMKKYYDFRLYGSDYKFVSSEVPFFAIALGGSVPLYSEYINFKADTTEYKLKLIESGVYPSFLLTYESPSNLIYTDSASLFSCEYSEYKSMIVEYDEIFTELSKILNGSKISDHFSKDSLAVTSYENGIKVVVNYNSEDVKYEDNIVKATSYLILDGKAVAK